MNTKTLIVLLCAIVLGFSQTACQHVVYAADMANLNRRYARGEITKKEYDDRKAHFDFERSLAGPLVTVGVTGPNQNSQGGRSPQPATPPMTLLPGEYRYTPQPQFVYVQGPPHRPGGGYTPQPQQVYVQGPAHNPGGGYTPQPQLVYTQGPAHNPGGGYTPQSQQAYVQNPQQAPSGGYTPEKAPQYVNNDRRSFSSGPANEQAPEMRYKTASEMNAKERREFEAQKLKPGTISNPGPEIAKRQGEKYDAAVKQIPWYLKWQYMFAKGATEDAFPLIKGAEKVNEMRDAQKRR